MLCRTHPSSDIVFLQDVLGALIIGTASAYGNWPDCLAPLRIFSPIGLLQDFAYCRNAVHPKAIRHALLSKFPIIEFQQSRRSVITAPRNAACYTPVLRRARASRSACHLRAPGLRESHRDAPAIASARRLAWTALSRRRRDCRRRLSTIGAAGRRPAVRTPALQEARFKGPFGAPAKSFPARWPHAARF